MKLGDAKPDDVVRNVSNSSYYRYVRPEDKRVRIRPLELFPNGLLIEKPTDTIVLPEIEVEVIGTWAEGMALENAQGGKSRRTYEQEREQLEEKLVQLEAEELTLPPNRLGSHKNKTNAARARLDVLQLGLTRRSQPERPPNGHTQGAIFPDTILANVVEIKDRVLLPSGRAGMVVGYIPVPGGELPQASILIKQATGLDLLACDQGLLKPIQNRHHATV